LSEDGFAFFGYLETDENIEQHLELIRKVFGSDVGVNNKLNLYCYLNDEVLA